MQMYIYYSQLNKTEVGQFIILSLVGSSTILFLAKKNNFFHDFQ